jgi:hypothetical protein
MAEQGEGVMHAVIGCDRSDVSAMSAACVAVFHMLCAEADRWTYILQREHAGCAASILE